MKQQILLHCAKGLTVLLCLLLWACGGGEKAAPTSPPAPLPEPRPEPPAPVVVPPPRPPVPEVPATRGPEEPLPQRHNWAPLLNMDEETPGYGMYTYVLFNRRLDTPARLTPETLSRYEELLNALAASTLSTEEVGELGSEAKRLTNLFYIPATHATNRPTLDNYNAVLAMRYLDEFKKMTHADNPQVAERLLTNPGPFLISTLKPAGEIDNRQSTLLYADLSTTNPAAMDEIVAAYKLRLGRDRVSETEKFAPLKLALLNLILNADDNIKLVKAAMAHWIPE